MRKVVVLIACVIMAAAQVTVSADQTSVERMLKENSDYIEFLNVCITNFGDKEKDRFFELYQLHFNADVAFLQSDYRRSYNDASQSQSKHIGVITDVLTTYYLEESKDILDKIAPSIIKSKNASARLFLTLAYRDRSIARNTQNMGDASNPRLFSSKISKYDQAIKTARRAMRYGLLALFESRDVEMKKYIYSHLFEMEREKGNRFYNRFLGTSGDSFVKELTIEFAEADKRDQAQKDAPAANPADPNATPAPVVQPQSFEKKVERETRFRVEKRVAEYLRDGEFNKADDIISHYIDDFSYKLILAMIEVLSTKEKESLPLQYDRLKIHHADNFSRLSKPSVLDSFAEQLKVTDEVKKGAVNPQDSQGAATQPQTQGQTTPAPSTPKTDQTTQPPSQGGK